MGFFQDLKEDLSLAMNELLPNDDMDEEIADPEEKKTNFKKKDSDKGDKAILDTVEENVSDADAFARELIDAALQPQQPKETEPLTVEQLVAAVEQSVSKEVSDMIEDEIPSNDDIMQELEEPTEVVVEETEEPVMPEEEFIAGEAAEPEKEVVVEEAAEPEEEVVTEETEEPVMQEEEFVAEEITEPEEEVIVEETAEPETAVTMEEPEGPVKPEDIQEAVETVPEEEPEVKEMLIRNDNSFEKEVYEEIMKENTGKDKAMKNELEKAVDEVVSERVESVMSQDVLDETAIVTKGMKVNGDISSQGSLDVLGSIKGNIEVLGKLNVSGEIEGNSNAAEVFADAAHITGEIHATGTVKVGINSVIIGNIFATSAVIAGAVKGDIDVHGPVVLDSSAIVMGNIKSKSVQMNNGAVIEGLCSQCYADVSPASFFKDMK
ncbi:MAG: polymer-forming cytoskeletal protein [Lachnospiraceae bacterium]